MPREPLSDKKRDAMYAAWCEKECARYVATKCQVSETTVQKYRRRDNWIDRREEARAVRHKKLDKKIVNEEVARVNTYKSIINAILNPYIRKLNALKAAKKPMELDLPLPLAEKLERLVKFLEGEPDSRPDNRSTVNIFNKPITELSDDELAKRKRELIERLDRCGVNRGSGKRSRFSTDN